MRYASLCLPLGLLLGLVLNSAFWAGTSIAEPTKITVRVIGKDATFIGSGQGGVEVVLKNAGDGTVLAQGRTEGSTGSNVHIMGGAKERGEQMATDGVARFDAVIEIDQPTRVVIEAWGPVERPEAANRVSASQWVIPGKHITQGDGWVLEMPGLVVEIMTPFEGTKLDGPAGTVTLKTHVTPMCGCAVKPGGFWDPQRYEVRAFVTKDGARIADQALTFAGSNSLFQTKVDLAAPGTYEALVYAYDPKNGNTGLDKVGFTVTVPESDDDDEDD